MLDTEDPPRAAYLATREFADHLIAELPHVRESYGRLIIADPPETPVFWAQNTWEEPFLVEIDSIRDAAKKLRAIQRNWAPYKHEHIRRMELIQTELPPLSAKPKPFPFDVPNNPMGSWTLLDERLLFASARCSSPFPNGEINFEENKVDPPSRAYLKLREALTLAGKRPGPGSFCLDAGASPGGWTWVLQGLGARVLSVDRAPLESRIANLPGVEYKAHSAFTLKPEDIGKVDWLVSDVICYPEKLYEWVSLWLESGLCENFVCTIKMQGEPETEVARRFAAIPGSKVVHLWNNKHELTWIRVA